MSFGLAVGDLIAVLGLFERVAIELKQYRGAPAQFQNLSVELDLLRSTLMHVLQSQTDDQDDKQIPERIRAIIHHCHQPLQAFIDKLRSKDSSLGHYRSARLNDVGIRIKWSMVTQKDVEELRKIMLSEMVAINMLLSVQQLASVRRLSARSINTRENLDAILDKTSVILDLVHNLPDSIANIHLDIAQHEEQQTRRDIQMTQMISGLTSQVKQMSVRGNKSMEMMRSSGARIMRAVTHLSSVLNDLRKLLHLLSKYSKDMLEAVRQNTRMLLDITGHMKRLARAIESIPLHLTVDIIRFDDALGESWGLPFQACQTWESFTDILKVVVYGNQRTGLDYITRGQFSLTLAKTGRSINQPYQWNSTIRPGAHVRQAMIVPELPYSKDACPYPICTGTLFSQDDEVGRICSLCGRVSSTTLVDALPLKLYANALSAPTPPNPAASQASAQAPTQKADTTRLGPMQLGIDSISLFRRIQVYERPPPLTSAEEAYEKLKHDASDLQANLYLGWRALGKKQIDEAIHRLELAISTDPVDWIPYYLLGRAYMSGNRLKEAYRTLQLCVYQHQNSPDVWITVGALYFRLNQHADSLDATARSIQLNDRVWESWYNLGVLYDVNNQKQDAILALQTALNQNPTLYSAHLRIEELQAGLLSDVLTTMVECGLLHISDPVPTYGENTEIKIRPLNHTDNDE